MVARLFAAAAALYSCAALKLEIDDTQVQTDFSKDVKGDKYGLKCMPYSARNVHKYVTAIVTSSPRKEDSTGEALAALKETVSSVHKTLALKGAQLVVAFDGLNYTEIETPKGQAYLKKVNDFAEWNKKEFGSAAFLYANKEWTNRPELLHRVFDFLVGEGKLTPVMFVAPDNAPVVGAVDVPYIFTALACDKTVDMVRFLWAEDCTQGKSVGWNAPCEQHSAFNLLQQAGRMSGRPHFATTSFYYDQIFHRISREYRGQMQLKTAGVKNSWIYGERNRMLHDKEIPLDVKTGRK